MPEETKDRCYITLRELCSYGIAGYLKDFVSWVQMEAIQKNESPSLYTEEIVASALETLRSEGLVQTSPKVPNEFFPTPSLLKKDTNWNFDEYQVLGAFEYSPIQLVRTRLEHFLFVNKVNDEDIMDISIATIEGIENAAKYGDGKQIIVSTRIQNRKLQLTITNQVKEFDLEKEIERGKYSVSSTLMRGIMVMQKLFSHLDLEIIDETKQARLYAEKNLS
ncbi:MAG: ATP-binding protein [Leptospiraceae bacterium]|nr:ATP-binding protein [Leptospiraceae bacterium]